MSAKVQPSDPGPEEERKAEPAAATPEVSHAATSGRVLFVPNAPAASPPSRGRRSSPRAPAEAVPDVEAGHEGALLEDAAESPESLAEALAELLGAEPALELVRGALDHLASRVSESTAARLLALPAQPEPAENPNDETFTEASAFAEEDDLQIIKAKTMHKMVEEINGGKCQLLFLTNPQAEKIANTPEAIKRMLNGPEVDTREYHESDHDSRSYHL